MTSLSNIFRSNNTITEEGKTREITIRSLAMPELSRARTDELTLDAVLAERDRLLEEAKHDDGARKSSTSNRCDKSPQKISHPCKLHGRMKRLVLQQQAYDEGFPSGL